jgi:serine phosphatase RsbU (regulator of sigma subunit)
LTWRKVLRNKPNAPYLTYGVFTGEKEVENYYRLGEIKIQKGDLVFLYSDGFLYFIKKTEFRNFFRKLRKGKLKKEVKEFVKKEIAKNLNEKTSEIFENDKTLISILI